MYIRSKCESFHTSIIGHIKVEIWNTKGKMTLKFYQESKSTLLQIFLALKDEAIG